MEQKVNNEELFQQIISPFSGLAPLLNDIGTNEKLLECKQHLPEIIGGIARKFIKKKIASKHLSKTYPEDTVTSVTDLSRSEIRDAVERCLYDEALTGKEVTKAFEKIYDSLPQLMEYLVDSEIWFMLYKDGFIDRGVDKSSVIIEEMGALSADLAETRIEYELENLLEYIEPKIESIVEKQLNIRAENPNTDAKDAS